MSGLFVVPEGAQIAPEYVTKEAEESLQADDGFAGLRITSCYAEFGAIAALEGVCDRITWLVDVEEVPDFTIGDARRLCDVFARTHKPLGIEMSYVPTSKTIVIVEVIVL